MKAKLVEKLDFQRGQGAKKSLNIGLAAKIKKELYKKYNDRTYEYRDYIYISPDFIIIRYKESLVDNMKQAEDVEKILPAWIIKYAQAEGYEAKPYSKKGSTWMDEDRTYDYAAIYEKRFRRADDPQQMAIEEDLMIKMSTSDDERAMEKCEIMAEALNEKMGPIEGFQLVEELKIPFEEYEDKIQELQNKGSI